MQMRLLAFIGQVYSALSTPNFTRWFCADILQDLLPCKKTFLSAWIEFQTRTTYRTLSTSYFNPPYRIPYSKLILVDPPIWGREKQDQPSEIFKMVEAMTPIRKDIWKSRDDATKWLSSRMPWGAWDERVLEKYTVWIIEMRHWRWLTVSAEIWPTLPSHRILSRQNDRSDIDDA